MVVCAAIIASIAVATRSDNGSAAHGTTTTTVATAAADIAASTASAVVASASEHSHTGENVIAEVPADPVVAVAARSENAVASTPVGMLVDAQSAATVDLDGAGDVVEAPQEADAVADVVDATAEVVLPQSGAKASTTASTAAAVVAAATVAEHTDTGEDVVAEVSADPVVAVAARSEGAVASTPVGVLVDAQSAATVDLDGAGDIVEAPQEADAVANVVDATAEVVLPQSGAKASTTAGTTAAVVAAWAACAHTTAG